MTGTFRSTMIIAFAMMITVNAVYSYSQSKRGIIKASASDFGLQEEDLEAMKRNEFSKGTVSKLSDENNLNGRRES